MMRTVCLLLACLLVFLCLPSACAEEAAPPREYAFQKKILYTYDTETLRFQVERFVYGGTDCYLTKVWMADPGRQIRKVTADWGKNIKQPAVLAKQVPESPLVINGSGYVSPRYPWIPEEYPGTNADYYYTPLGSLTVTDGTVFRDLTGIPYSGLTLESDGLHMYVNAENEEVLAAGPTQTWSFYDQCPVLLRNEDILPDEWDFADRRANRTVIARTDRNNYLILSVNNKTGKGLSLRAVSTFFRENFDTEWVYDLDGGPSSALLVRGQGKKIRRAVIGGTAKVADIMAFTEADGQSE